MKNEQNAVLIWLNRCAEHYNSSAPIIEKMINRESITKEEVLIIATFAGTFGKGYEAFSKGCPKL